MPKAWEARYHQRLLPAIPPADGPSPWISKNFLIGEECPYIVDSAPMHPAENVQSAARMHAPKEAPVDAATRAE